MTQKPTFQVPAPGTQEADAETTVRVVVTYAYEEFEPTKLLMVPPELDW
jgi:hypothetical protein